MENQKNFDIIEHERFTLFGRSSATTHYVDGVTQMFFGYPQTKFLLHTLMAPKNLTSLELRKAEQFLTMPTLVAIELANMILASAKQSEEQLLKDAHENAREKIREILSNYTLNSPQQNDK